MACYHPLTAYRTYAGERLSFNPRTGFSDRKIQVPCGQCIGCRLEKSRQWAVRIMHEASLYDVNSFVTLTYNDQNLPHTGTLVKKDFQDFIKRLRKRLSVKIRYYHCGEYGDDNHRPHYHAIIFGYWPQDCNVIRHDTGRGALYDTQFLSDVWGKGYVTIGNVSFESAAYVARYVIKKFVGPTADAHYERVDPVTGEVVNLQPEYSTMSRRPGIGGDWYSKYKKETYAHDSVIMRGREMRPPKFYDYLLEKEDKNFIESIKKERVKLALAFGDNSADRLEVKEVVKEASLKLKKRSV